MKFITGLIVSAVVSLLLMAGAVLALGHVCSPQGLMAPSARPVPIRFDDGHGYRLEPPALLLRVQLAEPPGNAKPAPLDWRRSFLCEIKATDIAIAGFGLFLVLSIVFQSLFQGLFMRRVLAASDRTAAGRGRGAHRRAARLSFPARIPRQHREKSAQRGNSDLHHSADLGKYRSDADAERPRPCQLEIFRARDARRIRLRRFRRGRKSRPVL